MFRITILPLTTPSEVTFPSSGGPLSRRPILFRVSVRARDCPLERKKMRLRFEYIFWYRRSVLSGRRAEGRTKKEVGGARFRRDNRASGAIKLKIAASLSLSPAPLLSGPFVSSEWMDGLDGRRRRESFSLYP